MLEWEGLAPAAGADVWGRESREQMGPPQAGAAPRGPLGPTGRTSGVLGSARLVPRLSTVSCWASQEERGD